MTASKRTDVAKTRKTTTMPHGTETFEKLILTYTYELFDPHRVKTCSLNPKKLGRTVSNPDGVGDPDGCPKKLIMVAQMSYSKISRTSIYRPLVFCSHPSRTMFELRMLTGRYQDLGPSLKIKAKEPNGWASLSRFGQGGTRLNPRRVAYALAEPVRPGNQCFT